MTDQESGCQTGTFEVILSVIFVCLEYQSPLMLGPRSSELQPSLEVAAHAAFEATCFSCSSLTLWLEQDCNRNFSRGAV